MAESPWVEMCAVLEHPDAQHRRFLLGRWRARWVAEVACAAVADDTPEIADVTHRYAERDVRYQLGAVIGSEARVTTRRQTVSDAPGFTSYEGRLAFLRQEPRS